MKKLKAYNQVVFAALGTLLLSMTIVISAKFIYEEFLRPEYIYEDNSLVVEEKLDSLKTSNLRPQIISLEGIKTFDTLTKSYLIPVYQKNLKSSVSLIRRYLD